MSSYIPSSLFVSSSLDRVFVTSYQEEAVVFSASLTNKFDVRILANSTQCAYPQAIDVNEVTGVTFVACGTGGNVISIDPAPDYTVRIVATSTQVPAPIGVVVNSATGIVYVSTELSGVFSVNGTNVTSVVPTSLCFSSVIGGLAIDPRREIVYVICAAADTITSTMIAVHSERASTFVANGECDIMSGVAVNGVTGVVVTSCSDLSTGGIRAYTPHPNGTVSTVSLTSAAQCIDASGVAVDDATGSVYAICQGTGIIGIVGGSSSESAVTVPLVYNSQCPVSLVAVSRADSMVVFGCSSVSTSTTQSGAIFTLSASTVTPLGLPAVASSSAVNCANPSAVGVQAATGRVFAACKRVGPHAYYSVLVALSGSSMTELASLPSEAASLAISSNGTIYVATQDAIIAITPDGRMSTLDASQQCTEPYKVTLDETRGLLFLLCDNSIIAVQIGGGVVHEIANTTQCSSGVDLALDRVTGIVYIACGSGTDLGTGGGAISILFDATTGSSVVSTVLNSTVCTAVSVSVDPNAGLLFVSDGAKIFMVDVAPAAGGGGGGAVEFVEITPFICFIWVGILVDPVTGLLYFGCPSTMIQARIVGRENLSTASAVVRTVMELSEQQCASAAAVIPNLGGVALICGGIVALRTQLDCPPGYTLTYAGCAACPLGTQRNLSQVLAGQKVCSTCASGAVTPTAGSTACTLCTPGTFAASPMIQCATCSAGSYTDSYGALACTLCPAGRFGSVGSNSSNCSGVCTAGYWCVQGSTSPTQIECGAQSVYCPTNSSQPIPVSLGMMTSDPSDLTRPSHTMTSQVPCPIGTYCDGSGVSRSCPAGSYQNETGQTMCSPCPLGMSSSDVGASVCTPCAAGTYSDFIGATTCTLCAHGSASNATGRTTVCDDCLPGHFQSQYGGTACESCGPQTFAPTSGMSTCPFCDFIVTADHTACSSAPCNASTQFNTTMQQCVTCPLGQYSAAGGSCGDCTPGTYTPAAGAGCVSCAGDDMTGLGCAAGLAYVDKNYWAFRVSDPSISSVPIFHTVACPDGFCPGSPLQVATQTAGLTADTTRGVGNGKQTAASKQTATPAPSNVITYCDWPRLNSPDNLLCGECAAGYMPWHQSCASCHGINWPLVFGIVILSLLLVAFLLWSSASDSTVVGGLTVVLLYFVQTAALIVAPVAANLDWLKVFNFTPTSVGTCIAEWTPLQQSLATIMTPVGLCAEMGLVALVHYLLGRYLARSAGSGIDPADAPTVSRCTRLTAALRRLTSDFRLDRYIGGCVAALLFCFTSVSRACLSLLYCLDVGDADLLFESPTVSCASDEYRRYHALVISVIVVYVVGLPIASAFLLSRDRRALYDSPQNASSNPLADHDQRSTALIGDFPLRSSPSSQDDLSGLGSFSLDSRSHSMVLLTTAGSDVDTTTGSVEPAASDATHFWRESRHEFRHRWGPLYVMYANHALYWQSLVLLRRAVFVLVSVVLLQSPAHRFMVFTLLNFASLMIHQLVHPFVDERTNRIESASYMLLAIVSAVLTGYQAPYPVSVEVVIALLVVPPALLLVSLIVAHHWRRVRHRLASLLRRSRSAAADSHQRVLPSAQVDAVDSINDAMTTRASAQDLQPDSHHHRDSVSARLDLTARAHTGADPSALDVPLIGRR